jgi:hypothetical protein
MRHVFRFIFVFSLLGGEGRLGWGEVYIPTHRKVRDGWGTRSLGVRGLLGGLSVGLLSLRLFGLGAEEGEEDDVADGFGVGEEHGEAVDAYAFSGGGGEAVAEGSDVVLVHVHGFFVAAILFGHLGFEAGALVVGVV